MRLTEALPFRRASATYIFENAIANFCGDLANRKIHDIHDRFCIGEEPEEGHVHTPVPALATLALLGLGLAGIGYRRHKAA